MKGTNMNLSFGLEVIYEDADFHIDAHDKAGIVGVNGAGKTTLFHVLMHEQELDSGTVSTGHLRIGYLPQEIILEDESCTVLEYLQSGRPIQKLENELNQIYQQLESADSSEHAQLFKQMEKLQSRLESLDYYEADSSLLHIIDRMQIDIDLLGMPLGNLSGGQKSQIAFARVLYAKSDILLLDEPTNHLDVDAKDSLQSAIKAFKGAVILVSHEPEFYLPIVDEVINLEECSTKII